MIGPVPLMVMAALVYFSDSEMVSGIRDWLKSKLRHDQKQALPAAQVGGEVNIDFVLGVLNQLSAWAVKSGNQPLLGKVTDLYKDLQTLGVKKVSS